MFRRNVLRPSRVAPVLATLAGTALIASLALAQQPAAPPSNPSNPNTPRNPSMPSSTQTPNRGTQGDSAITERLQNQDVQRCIELCGQCAESCERTSTHCLTLGGDHASAAHQIILRDCANICSTSACFMSRGSEHHSDVCSVCADICEQCAKDCDRLASGDPMMTECARICRECCEMCRTMAAMR